MKGVHHHTLNKENRHFPAIGYVASFSFLPFPMGRQAPPRPGAQLDLAQTLEPPLVEETEAHRACMQFICGAAVSCQGCLWTHELAFGREICSVV